MDTETNNEHWRIANMALLGVAIVTVFFGMASLITGDASPVPILIGLVMFLAYFFSRKRNFTALSFGTTLLAMDTILTLFALSRGLASPVGFMVRALILFLLLREIDGIYTPRHRRQLVKGLTVGVVVYVLFIPLIVLSTPSPEPPRKLGLSGELTNELYPYRSSSNLSCRFYRGEDRDLCILQEVLETRDLALCFDIEDVGYQNTCFAAAFHMTSTCNLTSNSTEDSDEFNFCMALMAINGSAYCQNITETGLKMDCLNMLL